MNWNEEDLMEDLISVIVPMYNVETYLEDTLNSIVNQTYTNVEIILINDASTDRTFDIAKNYAEKYPNIRLINQIINKGVSATRNLALKLAKGSYITFVDSDDLLAKQALENMYNTAKESNSDLVIGIYKNFSSESISPGGIYKRYKRLNEKGRIFPFTNPEIFFHTYCWGKLYKKELLSENTFPEGINYTEDQPFVIYTYFKAKKIYITPHVVYYYRGRDKKDSATQVALNFPEKHLQYVFDSFNVGKGYFNNNLYDNVEYGLLIYLSRVLEASIKYIFEGAIRLENQSILRNCINMLFNWIEKLDNKLVLGSDSFQTIFLNNGQEYIKYFDLENQRLYIQLIRLIRDKKNAGSQDYNQKINQQNEIYNNFFENIDTMLIDQNYVLDNNYSICYPTIKLVDKNEAVIDFQLLIGDSINHIKAGAFKENDDWKLLNLTKDGQLLVQPSKVINKKPKVLLTYRDFSGCNTLALYKSIPSYISEKFEVEIISGNKITNEFIQKVIDSDIIITTNMEYGFHKFHFNPNKIVIDLWHGFPLKNMFFKDSNYRDKNSITPYWQQFNYLLSYSNLYSEVVNECIKVNPNNFITTGAPRNDLLFSNNSREKLFELLAKNDENQKILVYMPTFRHSDQQNESNGSYNLFGFQDFDLDLLIDFLEENNYELIIKSHPIFKQDFEWISEISSRINLIESNELMNMGIDFYEVLGATDVLITDYSSVYIDFLLLDKPIIFTPTDLEQYEIERGFILNPYEKWTPGPKVINLSDLIQEILHYQFDENYYKDMRKEIRDLTHHYQDSFSSSRVWSFISSLCE